MGFSMQSTYTSPSDIINFSHCWVSVEKLHKCISADSDLQCIESSKIVPFLIIETDILDRNQTSGPFFQLQRSDASLQQKRNWPIKEKDG